MSFQIFHDDPTGDQFQTAFRTTTIPTITMPIPQDSTARVITETWLQDPDYFTATSLGTVHDVWDGTGGKSTAYLVEETGFTILDNGLQEWQKVFATIPATRYEFVVHSYVVLGAKTNSSSTNYLRKPFSKRVVARVEHRYFHTANPDADITLQKKFQPKHNGNEVDYVANNTTPQYSTYVQKVVDGDRIMADDSALERWKGNIYERRNLTVLAI